MSSIMISWMPRQAIVVTRGAVCGTTKELLSSELFAEVVHSFVCWLQRRDSPLLAVFETPHEDHDRDRTQTSTHDIPGRERALVSLLMALSALPLEQAARSVPEAAGFACDRRLLHEFVEALYDYWRRFNRFLVCYSEAETDEGGFGGAGVGLDRRPYRTFNDTVEQLTHVVRAAYRDICENITGDHPRIYRQVAAGAQAGLIAVPKDWPCPQGYRGLREVRFIRQVLIDPPLIIDPPMNKRTGEFLRVNENPLAGVRLRPEEWLCYPARVGPVVVFVYFHYKFMGLGCSLANLFELATEDQIKRGPDAIYAFGVPTEAMAKFGETPVVFHEDGDNDLLVAAVPGEDTFGYFGYLKKMTLTLHNVLVMKKLGRMPFHGAMTKIVLRSGHRAGVVIVGDTGTGKSESLEAFRALGHECIRELRVIADDMGSLEVARDGTLRGYGSEVGAFVRLDDLRPGYAFDQVDRAIIMSPHRTNARAVIPVTSIDEVLAGHPVHYLLYANNHEDAGVGRPVIERFHHVGEALAVFREGAAMSKGTTASTGLVRTYFANTFGPPEYRDLHESLASRVFEAAFTAGVFVGQVRTRLGIPGWEQAGPEAAARALLDLISNSSCGETAAAHPPHS